jgi:hypothetical protein
MSMICCAWCENYFDTDDGEGWFEPNSPFRFKCQTCLEQDNQGTDTSGNLVQYDEDGNETQVAA